MKLCDLCGTEINTDDDLHFIDLMHPDVIEQNVRFDVCVNCIRNIEDVLMNQMNALKNDIRTQTRDEGILLHVLKDGD